MVILYLRVGISSRIFSALVLSLPQRPQCNLHLVVIDFCVNANFEDNVVFL